MHLLQLWKKFLKTFSFSKTQGGGLLVVYYEISAACRGVLVSFKRYERLKEVAPIFFCITSAKTKLIILQIVRNKTDANNLS